MLEAIPVPALSDNYIWLVAAPGQKSVVVVDPGEAAPVLEALERNALEVAAILVTHHHGDHVGGLAEVAARYPDAPVYGPATEEVAGVTARVGGGDRVEVAALETVFDVIDTPGHTAGHVSFHGGGVLLCGDTLFAGGCGRVFEGSHAQMAASLARLAALPGDTRGCCGHEYTLKNLAFARAVEPDNEALAERERGAKALRDAGRPTVPFELAGELETNPFLRCDQPAVRAAAERHAGRALDDAAAVFGALRDWKDSF
ncbi:MAG: hydroxyacylglutathione hydrolase [Halofilum sp. (in: g-proteobacteria)]|nr:hydroxyacylglutathione hydrolase [Halofilum sp. (in: g-proteobacteria)]